MRKLSLAAALLASVCSRALPQTVISPSGYVQQAIPFTAGTQTFTVPPGVTIVYADGCGAGGPGGGGGATGSAAGGGGGGSAACVIGYPLYVTPGQTLTLTVPAAVTGPAANMTGGSGGGALTITGANNPFPPQSGGLPGSGVTGVTGGVGGNGAGSGSGAGGAAATAGTVASQNAPGSSPGGGGGGGSTASAGGAGGYSRFVWTPGGGGGGGPGNTATGAGGTSSAGCAWLRF